MARILFIQNFWFEYLGTMVLSSVLKRAGHTVDLLVERSEQDLMKEVAAFQPDIVAMYVVSGSHQWAAGRAEQIKSWLKTFVIVGGPHPTFFPEIVQNPGIDAVCIGEGEGAMLDLAACIDRGNSPVTIENLWVKSGGNITRNPLRPLIQNLDDLPDPDRQLYYKYKILRDSPSKHFITGRGCPFNCTFCCNKAYKALYKGLGRMVRRPNPDKICNEIIQVKQHYPLKAVRFDDEVFLLDAPWTLRFLQIYKERVNLPFSCLIRADIMTEELVKAMKDAGCYIAYFGIESGNDYIRNQILGKNISRQEIINTARLLKKYGIKIGTFNMVGMPSESFQDAWETVRLNQLIQSDYPWCSIIQPYPGTELESFAKDQGFLNADYGLANLNQSYFNDTVIRNPDADALVALQKLFYIAVRFPSLGLPIKWMIRRYGQQFWMRWVFNVTYAYRYSRTYKMPFWELLKRALLWKDSY